MESGHEVLTCTGQGINTRRNLKAQEPNTSNFTTTQQNTTTIHEIHHTHWSIIWYELPPFFVITHQMSSEQTMKAISLLAMFALGTFAMPCVPFALNADGFISYTPNSFLGSNPQAFGACYWQGTAPFCNPGDCPPGFYAQKVDPNGDGSRCWSGLKVYCCPEAK